jgi:SpoVK/Ycf46/Vps4 family AAA+-type ATPase
MGKTFSKYVGETESNVRAVQKVIESISPCIVWIDEIEKGLAGGGAGDGAGHEVTVRAIGSWLTWLQEKTAPAFVVATANDITGLRDELKRKGRFDEIFFVDIPTRREREQIARIHIGRRGEFVSKVDPVAMAEATDGYTGAEMEAAIIDAMRRAHYEKKEYVQTEDVLKAIERTTPMTKSSPKLLPSLRTWAKNGNIVRASSDTEEVAVPEVKEGDGFNRSMKL